MRHTLGVDDAGLATLTTPRDDLIREQLLPSDESGLRFEATAGPFVHYERRVEVLDEGAADDGVGTHAVVREDYEFKLPPGAWPFLVYPLMALGLRRTALTRRTPWWAPTQRLDPQAATVLGLLAAVSLVVGYLTFVLAQTMTYAAEEFEVGTAVQGDVLSIARLGAGLAVALTVMADRRGRQRLLVASIFVSILSTAAGALSPSVWLLGVTQAVNRGAGTAAAALIVVVLAEEMPKGARAWATAQVTMAGGLGSGGALLLLPLAELDTRGWRLLYLAPLLVVPLVVLVARQLPETRRFAHPHRDVSISGHMGRLWLVMAMMFLLNVLISPAMQLRNEFLRDERGFDAVELSLFTALSGGLAAIGVLVGGRLAERLGRRVVGGVAAVGTAVFLTASFMVVGPAMWLVATVGMISMAALAPSTTLYGAELFPTSMRGRANGIAGAVAMGGSIVGLMTAGRLVEHFGSFGPAIAVVALAPIVGAALIITRFPETAHQELEALNPEDVGEAAGSSSAAVAEHPIL